MGRLYHDRFSGRGVFIPSRAQLEAQKNADALRAQGVDTVGLRCNCCGLRLVDLSKIKVSGDGAIGPECSKHYPELYPCRHARKTPKLTTSNYEFDGD